MSIQERVERESAKESAPAVCSNPIRIVTAAALYDGHDAAINIMRRILQASGAEVIHLGHDRSVREVVSAAIQEDAQAVAISSYQGGHNEYFRYLRGELDAMGGAHVKIFGGGGGVIVPEEITALQHDGIERIFSPEDGRRIGLQGIINTILRASDFDTVAGGVRGLDRASLKTNAWNVIARAITCAERGLPEIEGWLAAEASAKQAPVLGITGTGGAGKSSLTDEIVRRYLRDHPERTVGIISVDPSKRKTGGALLGDRIRMNSIHSPRAYMRSMATRGSGSEVALATRDAIAILQAAGFDLVVVETSGIGQGASSIVDIADVTLYVMTSEYGAASQLEKIDMLDYADLVAINKFERSGSQDAFRDVARQMRRSRGLPSAPSLPAGAAQRSASEEGADMPVFGTIASRFNDPGVNGLYAALLERFSEESGRPHSTAIPMAQRARRSPRTWIIPPERTGYLGLITRACRDYRAWAHAQVDVARRLGQVQGALEQLNGKGDDALKTLAAELESRLEVSCQRLLAGWDAMRAAYSGEIYEYEVRGKKVRVPAATISLSGLRIPKVSLPRFVDPGERLRWLLFENLPGEYPYTAGVFPMKRAAEDPTRMFAGEGGPHRTNRRFHYLSKDSVAKRLSTAFDSVTLYGEDPDERPDIYGKIGDAGVSIATLADMKALFAGFDLTSPETSVSMTINGPAPMILAMFMCTAIDQETERFEREHGHVPTESERLAIKNRTLLNVRGTVQADILKEDQAQNTCIFSTEFALRLMGDIQEYFIANQVKNYYSVSISGYHIAEAGANPITQTAFTLANGFTYVEYYLARGMAIDDFAPNLSFFFSNGLDPEYSVIGRVARRIWSVAIDRVYGGSERSQKLKYHIQTSGRSLHAMEINFNDIRTTLQALTAYYDNCQSLHTNAYDEAVTTPTEESVRRALAIQQIITREFGGAKTENPLQGAFIIEELTDLVEEAVLAEFDRISERGGVLGAMETQYQRSRIQEESLHYERLKHSGELPIVGVNTFIDPHALADGASSGVKELSRASVVEKDEQIARLRLFQNAHSRSAAAALERLRSVALAGGNVFAELLECVRHASLGQISAALYDVGGSYRRNA